MWSRVSRHYSNIMRWRRTNSDNPRIQSYRTVLNFSPLEGAARFPKMEDCSHFHYGLVAFRELQLRLCENDTNRCQHCYHEPREQTFLIEVSSAKKKWTLCRTYSDFRTLDRQLHECVYTRGFSLLPDLSLEEKSKKSEKELVDLVRRYLSRFSKLATCLINCASVLKWLEIDNYGNRLLTMESCGLNTPAVAVAHVIKRYSAQAADEISFEVGDLVHVTDKFKPNVSTWWRGKKDFEIGFFPSECVELMEDTIPPFVASRVLKPCVIKEKSTRRRGLLKILFSKIRSNKKVFGSDLTEYLLKSGHEVPPVVESCADVIECCGIVENIYRKSGVKADIKRLRLAFNRGHDPDLMAEARGNIHCVSSLLKLYFYELPNPLLMYQLYDKFIAAVGDEQNRLTNLHSVVQQLPLHHFKTTEYLIRHLAYVSERERHTNVKLKTLAFIWTPILLRSMEMELDVAADPSQVAVIECLISHSNVIFSEKVSLYSVPNFHTPKEKNNKKLLSKSRLLRVISLRRARKRNEMMTTALDPDQVYIDVPVYPDTHSSGKVSKKCTEKERCIPRRRFPDIELLNINNSCSQDSDVNLQNNQVCDPSVDLQQIHITFWQVTEDQTQQWTPADSLQYLSSGATLRTFI